MDECRFCVMPFAIGQELSLFRELERPQALRLVSSKPFGCGAIEMIYERVAAQGAMAAAAG